MDRWRDEARRYGHKIRTIDRILAGKPDNPAFIAKLKQERRHLAHLKAEAETRRKQ